MGGAMRARSLRFDPEIGGIVAAVGDFTANDSRLEMLFKELERFYMTPEERERAFKKAGRRPRSRKFLK